MSVLALSAQSLRLSVSRAPGRAIVRFTGQVMTPVSTQSIWKASGRLADGREIVYFDEAPGLDRAEHVPRTAARP